MEKEFIRPKSDLNLETAQRLIHYGNSLELQDFRCKKNEYISSVETLVKIITKLSLKEITYHTPFSRCYLDVEVAHNYEGLKMFIELLGNVSRLTDCKITLLFHMTCINKTFAVYDDVIQKVQEVFELCKNNGVHLILENSIIALNYFGQTCSAFNIARQLGIDVCVDLCHLKISINMYKNISGEMDYSKVIGTPEELNIYQIHCSSIRNNDGYVEHGTHGVAHEGLSSLIDDYFNLSDWYKGDLSKCFWIPEVAEEYYPNIRREQQIKEIKMLYNLCDARINEDIHYQRKIIKKVI